MTDFRELLRLLTDGGVEFLVTGGAAATAHGSAQLTEDLDIVYRRTPENIQRLSAALEKLSPYPRGAPPGLPFQWHSKTLTRGLNFTLTTDLGDLDLLGEITGGGGYDDLLPHCVVLNAFGVPYSCLGLKRLIEVKRAAGRPKDLQALAELEALREESEN